jgi:hypothetical protein
MEIFDLNKLLFFIFFFVPGFISMKVWRAMVPGRVISWTDSIFEAITYSCFNLAAFFWVFVLLGRSDLTKNRLFWYYSATTLNLFVTPLLWPIVLRGLLSTKCMQRWMSHPTPTAWDHFFGQRDECWVLVRLKTGLLIGGKYSEGSYVSHYPEPQDLYLVEVWNVDKNGAFVDKVERTKGMWIHRDAFDYLEFFT